MMKSKIWISIAAVLVVSLIVGAVWTWPSRTAPEVVEMRKLTQQLFDVENVSDEERLRIGERMREIKENIPDNRREEVYRQMEQEFRQQVSGHFREFAALPEQDRDAFLDRDIARMKAMKAMWSQGRKNKTPADTAAWSDAKAAGKSRDKRPMTEEERQAWRRKKLDNSSAEDRAYKAEYVKALKQRLLERGIEFFKGRKISR